MCLSDRPNPVRKVYALKRVSANLWFSSINSQLNQNNKQKMNMAYRRAWRSKCRSQSEDSGASEPFPFWKIKSVFLCNLLTIDNYKREQTSLVPGSYFYHVLPTHGPITITQLQYRKSNYCGLKMMIDFTWSTGVGSEGAKLTICQLWQRQLISA